VVLPEKVKLILPAWSLFVVVDIKFEKNYARYKFIFPFNYYNNMFTTSLPAANKCFYAIAVAG